MKTPTITDEKIEELRKKATSLIELKAKSTQVVGWYAHSEEIRGPFCRWFTVSKREDDVEKGNLAWWWDDVAFGAAAMNDSPALAEAFLALLAFVEEQAVGLAVSADLISARDRRIERLRDENERLEADCAAMSRDLQSFKERIPNESFPNECDGGDTWLLDTDTVEDWIEKTLSKPNPGSDLLKELEELDELRGKVKVAREVLEKIVLITGTSSEANLTARTALAALGDAT